MSTSSWLPLLDGEARERAVARIRSVAEALLAREEKGIDDGPSLFSGDAGIALLFAWLDREGVWPDGLAVAWRRQERALEALAGRASDPTLGHGFPGVAWTVEHLERRFGEGEDVTEAIDEALQELAARRPWTFPFDLVQGLVGHGVYALERLPREGGRRLLEAVVDLLAGLAAEDGDGVSWFTPPHLVAEIRKAYFPAGHFDLGLAHGSPGVIALLAAAHGRGVRVETCRGLLERAVPWLLARRLPPEAGGGFAAFAQSGAQPARLAWCYGDLGIAAALRAAARALDRPEWHEAARSLALAAAARPARAAGVVDAGLCHGAAGIGHLFNRFFQSSGEPALGAAARFWLGVALDLGSAGLGVGGFRSFTGSETPGEPGRWHDTAGLLEGAAGVALALLAAVSSEEPVWDSCLLLSSFPVAPLPPAIDHSHHQGEKP